MAKKKKKTKQNRNKNKKNRVLPGPYLAGPVDSPANWPGASRPLPLPVGRGGRQRTRAPWRHATSMPACVPRHRDASGLLFGAASNPWTPSLVPFVSPSPLPLAHPNAIVAAVRHRRSHSHSLAPSSYPRALPVLPRPPRRLMRPEEPRNAAPDVFPLAGRRGSSPSIRPLRRAPEPTNPPCSSAVSP